MISRRTSGNITSQARARSPTDLQDLTLDRPGAGTGDRKIGKETGGLKGCINISFRHLPLFLATFLYILVEKEAETVLGNTTVKFSRAHLLYSLR